MHLDADIYRPDAEGEFPVLLMRQLDGAIASTQGYIHVELSQHLPLRVSLQATWIRIAKGNALRLSLSAACFSA